MIDVFGEIWAVLVLLSIAGALGGVIGALSWVPIPRIYQEGIKAFGSNLRLFGSLAVGAVTGVGAAIAVTLVLVIPEVTGIDENTGVFFKLFAVGVIAGFAGNRLLQRLTDQLLNEEVRGLQRNLNEVRREIQHTDEDSAIQDAQILLGQSKDQASSAAIDGAIAKLQEVLQFDPTNRRAAITLGRVKRKFTNYDAAIKSLSAVIAAREEAGLRDSDTADLLYNRSCYYARLYGDTGNENYKVAALEDLEKSVRLNENNRKSAWNDRDNDFENLLEAPEFEEVCGPRPANST